MIHRTIVGLLAGIALLVTQACGSSLTVRSWEPAAASLGAAKELVIIQGEGRRSARETVFLEMTNQARATGYYRVIDKSEGGMTVKLAGRTATVEGGEGEALSAGQAGLRVDIIDWDADQQTTVKERTDKKGRTTKYTTRKLDAKVLLGVTVFGADGKAVLAEKEFTGVFSTSKDDVSDDTALKQAAKKAVAQVLAMVTPKQVARRVKLDEDDEKQASFIDMAKSNKLQDARQGLTTYLESNPKNAGAAYNLAVVCDALGDYQIAIGYYDQALANGDKAMYAQGRASCAKRIADLEALSQ